MTRVEGPKPTHSKRLRVKIEGPKNVGILNALETISYCQEELEKNPTSHELYLDLVTNFILMNQAVLYGGPLGGGTQFTKDAYIKIRNIHAKAGCDAPTNKCEIL